MIIKNPFEKRSYFITFDDDARLNILDWACESEVNFTMSHGQIWFKTDEDELMFILRWLS